MVSLDAVDDLGLDRLHFNVSILLNLLLHVLLPTQKHSRIAAFVDEMLAFERGSAIERETQNFSSVSLLCCVVV